MALAPSANLLRLDDCLAAKPTGQRPQRDRSWCSLERKIVVLLPRPLQIRYSCNHYDDMGDAATVNSLHAGLLALATVLKWKSTRNLGLVVVVLVRVPSSADDCNEWTRDKARNDETTTIHPPGLHDSWARSGKKSSTPLRLKATTSAVVVVAGGGLATLCCLRSGESRWAELCWTALVVRICSPCSSNLPRPHTSAFWWLLYIPAKRKRGFF